jgi:methionyl-tRNA formyltransferase
MLLDKEMDHGPILTKTAFMLHPESNASSLEVECGQIGGELLVQVIPHYLDGVLIPKEQDHAKATICKKITKELGCITLQDSVEEVRRKYRALTPWPGLYFFINHKNITMRVKVQSIDLTTKKESTIASDYILTVTPEGKKEMTWDSFKRGYLQENH